MDVDKFISANRPDEGGDTFQLENDKLLDVAVDGTVLTKAGAMVAYDGDLTFTGKSNAEGGLTGFVKSKATSEGTPVMEVEGTGHLYVADQAKEIQIMDLNEGESISVNGNDVLAFESSVDYSISTIGSLAGSSTGGLTNVFLEGPGSVAITTHGDPLVLTPPVKTDPAATVAWSADNSPSSSVNRSLSDMVGQSSGEQYQLEFTNPDGFVVVQPFEEVGPQQ
ncbi:AIM24 family protein [Halomicroarcula sp. F13]|uniref:AIM24 family protein n=1 Tax=Haloarcula rubra TaxID=2487747 RepID=A0AAW4PNR0_9EURY|nr:AIM24 family protein [Halomicroarcula rubra]MBX0322714.1 AIM24 family protein [Halomicroarcula rubra]